MAIRAIVFDQIGAGTGLILRELPMPRPGDGEVLYKVAAFGLNQADLLITQGRHYVTSALPMRLGYEASGFVAAVGSNVRGFKEGDPVTCIPNPDGPYATGGTFAIAQERFLTAWPAGLTAAEAAALWMQYLNSYYPMVELFPVKPGDWVLITAASGGTGTGTIHMARLLGGRVIATTRAPEKKAVYLKEQGAEHVVATYAPDFVKEIAAITGGTGVRLICDSLGGAEVGRLAQVLAPQGTLYVQGGLSGSEKLSLSALDLVKRGAGLYGYSTINELRKPGALERGRNFVLNAIAARRLARPVVDRVFPFEQAPQAYEYLSAGAQRGKVVVEVADGSGEGRMREQGAC